MLNSELIAVLAYPELRDLDRAWIENLRRVEDPEFAAVRPHFTLAFPAPVPGPKAVLHAAGVALEFASFTFELKTLIAVPDRVRRGSHVFLVPSKGSTEIHALHAALADGPFRPHLIPGVPFIPHMTVAAHERERDSQQLVSRLNGKVPPIKGSVRHLDVVEVWPERTLSIRRLSLANRNST